MTTTTRWLMRRRGSLLPLQLLVQSSLLLCLLLLSSVVHGQTQQYFTNTVNERAVSCPDDPLQIGYKHITDVNMDQQSELERLAKGEPARTPYIFPFCNRFMYYTTKDKNGEVLQALLDDVTFVCGYNGTVDELCVLMGGKVQVNVPAGSTTKRNIVFQGMSFYGFHGISTNAHGGSSASKITFNDCKWQDFWNESIAVHQYNPLNDGEKPMTVEVNKAQFENGTGLNLFHNVGGYFSAKDIRILKDVRADAIVSTSGGGTSTVSTVNVTLSDIYRVTHTSEGSTQSITGVKVHDMYSLGSILFVEGKDSTLTASMVEVYDNNLLDAYEADVQTSKNFDVLIAANGSIASIDVVSVMDNTGVDRIFSASTGARVSVTDATIARLVGTQPPDLLSNVAMSEDGGSMNVLRLHASEIEHFSAVFFAICGSFIQVKQSCIMAGKIAAPVFVSADSSFDSDGNYIDTEALTTDRCRNDVNASVFREFSVDDQCFSDTGTGTCTGRCVPGFTESIACLIGSNHTTSHHTMEPVPAPLTDGTGNPSCPASPPTAPPTLPPRVAGGGVQSGADAYTVTLEPVFTATIPPGFPGGAPINAPGASVNSAVGGGSGGGESFNNGNGGGNGGGGGSGATTQQRQGFSMVAVQVGLTVVVAKLMHQFLI